jgi:methylmalonyl-CoA mutase N-terminal domain/subunit
VETLTTQIESAVMDILRKVEGMGGTIAAVETGYFQREIAESAFRLSQRKSSGEHVVIGVNKFSDSSQPKERIEIHKIDPDTERRQIERVQAVRRGRDQSRVDGLLGELERQARDPVRNLMPATIELVEARATIGEIVERLRNVFGSCRQNTSF